jgi:hypothetical protein
MRIAIPTLNGRVSPTSEIATRLLSIDVEPEGGA